MTDQPQNETPAQQEQPQDPQAAPKPEGEVPAPVNPLPPPMPPVSDPGDASSSIAATFEERPEVAAGAAFAGGLLLALILKRRAR